jgi:diguanylate cyclase (GGDEF)-like protein/PAS domain S-box-containing protein
VESWANELLNKPTSLAKTNMLKKENTRSIIWLVPVILSLVLIPCSFISMALFHTLIEFITIIIAIMSFVVAWNTFPLSRNTILLFLGCGYFWVGTIDLLHTITFEGAQLIPGLNLGSTIQFWIIARYLEAFILLLAPFIGKYSFQPFKVMVLIGLLSLMAVIAQLNNLMPVMFVPGQGLTTTKIVSEYLIILLLSFAGISLYLKRKSIGITNTKLMILSIIFTIFAELSFTLYVGLKELPLVLGHIFKLFSFWLIYRVLIESSLLQPIRSLSQIVESYDAASDETIIINQEGELLKANLVIRNRLGSAVLNMHSHEVLHDKSLSKEDCPQCQAIVAQNTLEGFEYFCPEDQQWYESSLSGIHFSESFSAMIHSRRCITVRKKAEHKLANLSRLYLVLSHSNKAIVRLREPNELFNKLCEIAVKYGDFKMAWIGTIDGAIVRPEFYAGEETGYLKEMTMRVDDSALAQGPVGRTAKSQQVSCVNNVSTDSDFGPWRQAAEQRGYKALAAVPIKSNNHVIGIFTLYSHQENVFDEAMLALLSSLSDDISAAYRNIHQDKLKKEADATIRKLSSAIEQGVNAILICTADGVIDYVNTGFINLSAYHAEDVIGMNQNDFQGGLFHEHVYQKIWSSVLEHEYWQGEVLNKRFDGERYWSILSVSSIRNEDGVITHYLWSSTDNTKLHDAQETINRLAFYDSLTGLANRRLLMDRLDHAIMGAKRHGEMVAVMMCDLDNFKMINDSLGHDAGDELLKHIAQSMKSFIREDDLVARLGGDEFVVVLDGVAGAGEVIDIAGLMLSQLEKPIELLGNQVSVSSSIGIAMYPQDELQPSQLLRNADLAMYHAKDSGKNRFQFYQAEMNQKAQGRLKLEHRLRKAIEEQAFEVWYQPQVSIKNSRIIGFEALIRWREGDVMVQPNEFIPLAEETGMIENLGDFVLKQAYEDWSKVSDIYPGCSMAVNVSAYQFRKSDHLYSVINELLEKNVIIDKSLFIIEMTESALIQDVSSTIKTLGLLKTLGLSLSIDDFGTGYSSLSRLKEFPIDQLKIDRSFIKDLLDDQHDKAIVSAIIAIAQQLNLKLVAEGIELQAQADLLLSNGCAHAQGFHYFKPMPLAEILMIDR